MTEQQAPVGETDQMWVPPREPTGTLEWMVERAVLAHLRNPEPAAVDWAVQHHSFIRNRAQLVRDLHAYAEALERVILPAVKP